MRSRTGRAVSDCVVKAGSREAGVVLVRSRRRGIDNVIPCEWKIAGLHLGVFRRTIEGDCLARSENTKKLVGAVEDDVTFYLLSWGPVDKTGKRAVELCM